MEFTPEQQAFIDGLVNKKYTEAYAKAKEKYDLALAEMTTNIKSEADKYKAEAETLKTAQGRSNGEDVTALKAEVEKLKAGRIKDAEDKRELILKNAAAELNAVSPSQVATLIRQNLKTDDNGNLSVVNAEGQPRLNAEGEPMTEKELIKEFLSNNPHLVKASGSSGAGSIGGTAFNAGSAKTIKRDAYEKMGPAAKMDYIKAGGAITD